MRYFLAILVALWSQNGFCFQIPDPASSDVKTELKGLALQYPRDLKIASDSAVLFHEDFEAGELGDSWDEVNKRLVRKATDQNNPLQNEVNIRIARGKRSARVHLNQVGHEDVTLVKRLDLGYDELLMRYYVRYGSDYGYHGHGGSGFMADAGHGGFKGAGKAPDGDKFFWATLEPIGPRDWQPPGTLIFYAYWWKMKPDGRGNYWGNWFDLQFVSVPNRVTNECNRRSIYNGFLDNGGVRGTGLDGYVRHASNRGRLSRRCTTR